MCVTQWSLVCAGFSWLLHQCDIINVPCSLYRHAHHWEDNGDPLPRPTTPTITESMAIQCVCVLPRGLINISIPPVLSPAHTLSTESLPEFIVHHWHNGRAVYALLTGAPPRLRPFPCPAHPSEETSWCTISTGAGGWGLQCRKIPKSCYIMMLRR